VKHNFFFNSMCFSHALIKQTCASRMFRKTFFLEIWLEEFLQTGFVENLYPSIIITKKLFFFKKEKEKRKKTTNKWFAVIKICLFLNLAVEVLRNEIKMSNFKLLKLFSQPLGSFGFAISKSVI